MQRLSKQNQNGFTLMEALVALIIFSVISIATYSFMNTFKKSGDDTLAAIDSSIEAILVERVLRNDLSGSSPSFNNLTISDDNDRLFFELLSDYFCNTNCTRQKTLSSKSQAKEFIISINDTQLAHRVPPKIYPPTRAYDSTPHNDVNIAGTLIFRGVNHTSALEQIIPPSSYPGFWASNQILLFYSMASLRPPSAVPDLSIPARNSIYVGLFNPGNSGMNSVNPQNIFNLRHPVDPSVDMGTGNGFDTFLKTLPPVGGTEALLLFKPINIIKYNVTNHESGKGTINIFRTFWDPNTNNWSQNAQLIAADVDGIRFFRDNISSPVIRFQVYRHGIDPVDLADGISDDPL